MKEGVSVKEYNIIRLEENLEYSNLVIMCNANSPLDYIQIIKEDLAKIKTNGKVLIDQILHVGNTNKRFISLDYKSNEIQFVDIPKKELYRKISCDYLRESNLVEYSILTSIQKRMIKKGMKI